jgi:hypothetical protein
MNDKITSTLVDVRMLTKTKSRGRFMPGDLPFVKVPNMTCESDTKR